MNDIVAAFNQWQFSSFQYDHTYIDQMKSLVRFVREEKRYSNLI